jgi:hypothetical protein
MRSLAGVNLPLKMPSHEYITASGLAVQRPQSSTVDFISIFDLETLLSPGIILFPGRCGLLIPIRETFARNLLGDLRGQMNFLPSKEALLRVEKAYFKTPRGSELFDKGMPIIFYISGHRRPMPARLRPAPARHWPVPARPVLRPARRSELPAGGLRGELGRRWRGSVRISLASRTRRRPADAGLRLRTSGPVWGRIGDSPIGGTEAGCPLGGIVVQAAR